MSGFTRKFKRRNGVGYSPTDRERRMLQALHSAAFVLKQYADGNNWAEMDGKSIWVGEGKGPDLAVMALGKKTATKPEPKAEEETTDGVQ